MKEYQEIAITKESLDTVTIGDYFKYNDDKRGMKVRAVSENYFIIATSAFGQALYSICHKNPINYDYNHMKKGFPVMSPDDCWGKYNYTDRYECEQALIDLENGDMSYSRRGVALTKAFVKKQAQKA